MSKGHVFIAQNNQTTDYIRQAYALALSIKRHNKINNTCLITNDTVPLEYIHAFDHIVPIPWTDLSKSSEWKIENRWKIIHATPFKENIVYDVDMLLLTSNDHWWDYLNRNDIVLTSNVKDYRGNNITSDFYRKTFTTNKLPNVYVGVFYFKKVNRAFEFFKWLEVINNNWKEFYSNFTPLRSQNWSSVDVNAALAFKFMGLECTNTLPTFVHMKPNIQGWPSSPSKWTEYVNYTFNDNCQLRISNILQHGIFHYTENQFLTDDVIYKLSSTAC